MRCKVVLAALAWSWLSTACASAQEARTLEHQGVARSFLITNQAAAADGPKPAVIFLHGLRRPPQPISSSPPLDALAAREGFVAVYPAALDGSWNYVAQNVSLSRAGTEIADDIGFLSKLIDALVADKIADPSRIYVAGLSQGGFLAYSVLCKISPQGSPGRTAPCQHDRGADFRSADPGALFPPRSSRARTMRSCCTTAGSIPHIGSHPCPRRWSSGASATAAPVRSPPWCRGRMRRAQPESGCSNGPGAAPMAPCGYFGSWAEAIPCHLQLR